MTGWKTALIGLGKIGLKLSQDPVHKIAFPYATHAQVLLDHHAFDWIAAVDTDQTTRQSVKEMVGHLDVACTTESLQSRRAIEVAVIATPPNERTSILESMPNLKAVLIEKPMGSDVEMARRFLSYCSARSIFVLVCLPRRFDKSFRQLMHGGLHDRIGQLVATFGTYGNGLANNGSHLLDMIRMLIGEVISVQAVAGQSVFKEGPILGDLNIAFVCELANHQTVMVNPVWFSNYREVGLDIWGSDGRFQIMNEGMTFSCSPRQASRILSNAAEIAHDQTSIETSSVGHALYDVYDNLHSVLQGEEAYCTGADGLRAMQLVEAIRLSAQTAGARVDCRF